jgi:hypothetical protein
MGLLTQTAEPAKEILGVETIEAVADKGYFKFERLFLAAFAVMARICNAYADKGYDAITIATPPPKT